MLNRFVFVMFLFVLTLGLVIPITDRSSNNYSNIIYYKQ